MLAEGPQMLKTSSHRLLWVDTDTRHIISVKLQGFIMPLKTLWRSTMGVQSLSTEPTLLTPIDTERLFVKSHSSHQSVQSRHSEN